ncbi:MAG: hypothetical protein QXT64_02725 [Desulfurococcaceae archaeon]
MVEAKQMEVKRITRIPEQLLLCTDELCEKINKHYKALDEEQKKIIYGLYLVLENAIEHLIASEHIEPRKIEPIMVLYPEKAGGKLGLSRARACEYLRSMYGIDISESTLKRLLNDKLYTPYEQFVQAVILNIIEKRERAVREKAKKYIIPTSWEEFINRPLIKNIVTAMRSKGLKETHINRTISEFYRYCMVNSPEHDLTPVAPEYVVDKASSTDPLDREEVYSRTDRYLQYRLEKLEEKGFEPDINRLVSTFQTIQKWLGTRLLRPGITQQEYKGKYQTAEIPLSVRVKLVRDLLEEWRKTKDKLYLKIIQGLIILYYTGSRRMVLVKVPGEPRLRIDFSATIKADWDKVVQVYNEREFYRVVTIEKRGIRFNKIIPKSWGDLVRKFELFTEDEIDKATRILTRIIKKYESELNEDTRRYLRHSKVWHIWRHTANREALIAFEWNRMIVSKLLGWIKEQNLQIYGDYSIDQIFQLRPERIELKFVDDSTKREIIRELQRANLL